MILLALMPVGVTSRAQTCTPQVGDRVETENGIFIVKGENIIKNPSFDEGLAWWTSGTGADLTENRFEVVAEGGADGGTYLKSLNSAGSGTDSSIKTGWAVTEGKTYLLSFWAHRKSIDGNVQYSRVYLANSQTGTDSQIASVQYVANTWTQNKVVFTADKPFCVVNFGWLNAPTCFDEFYLGELELSPELATAKLEAAIAEAQLLYASTEEGDARGQYTTAVRSALQEAIAEAEYVLKSATTQDEINSAVTALKAAVTTYGNSKNPPFKVGVQYVFTNVAASPYVLSSGGDGGTVKVAEEGVDNTTVFTFVPAPEDAAAAGYNLKDADGNFIYRSGSWDTKASSTADLTAANAIFQIVDYDSYVQIKNMGSGSVLGLDNTANGSTVYSNKNGSDTRYRWIMAKYVPVDQRDDKYYFDMELEEAWKIYRSVDEKNVGTRTFAISATAYSALGEALQQAEAMSDYTAARQVVAEAVESYKANYINKVVEGTTFYITHVSGKKLYQAEGSAQPVLYAADEETEQTFSFIPTNIENYYFLQNNETGSYLFHKTANNWDTSWNLDVPTGDEGLWKVEIYSDTLFTLKNRGIGGYLGTDATTSGASIYCDKAASALNSHWNVSDGSDRVKVDRTAYLAAMEAATGLLSSMVEGYEVGQYFQSDIDAFAMQLDQVDADAKKARDQASLDAIVMQLQADMDACRAKAHAAVMADEYLKRLVEACNAQLVAAVVGFEKGNYPQAAVDRYAEAIGKADGAEDAEAAIASLLTARDAFVASVCTVDRSAFKVSIDNASSNTANAVAGDCDGQYPQEAIDELAKAIGVATASYNQPEATQQDIDAAKDALDDAMKVFQATRVAIDFTGLRAAISNATKAMKDAEAEKGEGAGHFPASSFEALQVVIDQASAMNGSKTVNQQAVDGMTAEVDDAVLAFAASRVPNDYSQLDALLELAQQIYDNALAEGTLCREDLEELAISIEKGRTARQSHLQDDIDKAVRILRRDTELYNEIASVIVALAGGAACDAYSLNGTLAGSSLQQLSRGVYILRLDIGGKSRAVKIMVK